MSHHDPEKRSGRAMGPYRYKKIPIISGVRKGVLWFVD